MRFFLLVFLLSVPFWVIGNATDIKLFSDLPISALGFICPGLAAAILVYQSGKGPALRMLFSRSFDYDQIRARVWYAPVLLLMPTITAATYEVMRVTGALPQARRVSPVVLLFSFLAFCLAASAEELGWSGYVIEALQKRWNALISSLLVGVVWAAWHLVPLAQAHRSAVWIGWWALYTVALRVILVWLYNNTGRSVFAATLFHSSSNFSSLTFSQYFDPHITGMIVAFLAILVVFVSGPRTFVRRTECE